MNSTKPEVVTTDSEVPEGEITTEAKLGVAVSQTPETTGTVELVDIRSVPSSKMSGTIHLRYRPRSRVFDKTDTATPG